MLASWMNRIISMHSLYDISFESAKQNHESSTLFKRLEVCPKAAKVYLILLLTETFILVSHCRGYHW